MEKIEAPYQIDTWRIICASQSEPDYSEDRYILLYDDEKYSGCYVLLSGGHCSCYDWDEVEWCAVKYTKDELIKLADGNIDNIIDAGFKYTNTHGEILFWNSVLLAVEGKLDRGSLDWLADE